MPSIIIIIIVIVIGEDDNEWFVVVAVEGIWLSLTVVVFVVDNDPLDVVDSLFSDRRVSGKLGGVAGVFAGVISWVQSNNKKKDFLS